MADSNSGGNKLAAGGAQNAEGPKKTGGVDWMELSKVVAMPLVTLLVGGFFSYSLSSRQEADQRGQLYVNMMSKREESDSGMRKDMFQSILATFLKQEDKKPPDPEKEVLNIELLAYNFHESLDLGPLFKHVRRDLEHVSDQNLLWRIEKVAKDVKEQQLAILADKGKVDWADLDLETMTATFGNSLVEPPAGKERGGPTLCMSINSDSGETHWRQFALRFLDFHKGRREVEMSLSISRPLTKEDCNTILDSKKELENTEAHAQFWVGLFAFPMIDNTHLTHSERCAVSVTDISDRDVSASISVSFFQASRASLKDKLYYDEILHDVYGAGKPEVGDH